MPPQEKWKTRSKDADWSVERDQARGRGALSNASGRFEKQYAEPFDDGWDKDEKPETLFDKVTFDPRGDLEAYARSFKVSTLNG